MAYALEVNTTTFPAAKFVSISTLINILLPLVYVVAALALLAVLMLGGFKWITAGGNPEKLEGAQKAIRYAIMGFVIIAFSYLIVRLLGYALGIDFMI